MTSEKKPYYGNSEQPVQIRELVKLEDPLDSTVCFGDKRLVFTGELCIDEVKGSYKWGHEVTINLWLIGMPKIEKRAENDGYSRVAISLPPGKMRLLCEKLLTELWELGI